MAGPVVAAAVVWPKELFCIDIIDSKLTKKKDRPFLVDFINKNALAIGIGIVSPEKIDEINILNASILAMHVALDNIQINFDRLLIDGNRFKPYKDKIHNCIIKGDSKFISIAAASIIAKYKRDEIMLAYHSKYPEYGFDKNMGYPTLFHRNALLKYSYTDIHRKTFKHVLPSNQLSLFK